MATAGRQGKDSSEDPPKAPDIVTRVLVMLDQLPPVLRAQAAGELADHAAAAQFGAVRRAAIYEATRVGGVTYDDVAQQLGVSPSAINKAVTAHRRTLPNH